MQDYNDADDYLRGDHPAQLESRRCLWGIS